MVITWRSFQKEKHIMLYIKALLIFVFGSDAGKP